MSAFEPKNKRKRPNFSSSDGLLHPGNWRGKRSRSVSPAESSPDSGVSTPLDSYSREDEQSFPGPNIRSLVGNHGQPLQVAKPTRGLSWAGLEQALQALQLTTEVCPPLHSAVESLKSFLHMFKEEAKDRSTYDDLTARLQTIVELLGKHLLKSESREITDAINGIAEKIKREVESIDQLKSRTIQRQVLGRLTNEEDLIRHDQRIEQLFCQLQGEASMGSWGVASRHLDNTQLESLRPAKLASFDSEHSIDVGRRACTKNTRTAILDSFATWADDPKGRKIFWMNGMAGTGKTTIAYSLCERLEDTRQLAASFFCTRTLPECSDAKRIVPTMAYQIARFSSPFRDALCDALNKDPDMGTRNLSKQFEHIFERPLIKVQDGMERNLVVVIDALDECTDPQVVARILSMLFKFAASSPIKFFITSRPEHPIRNSMMLGIPEYDRSNSILHLHEAEESLVQADIRLYLEDELSNMLPDHSMEIVDLAQKSGNLFIYAATAVRHIQPPGRAVHSKQRLRAILALSNQPNDGLSKIHQLYYAILSAALNDDCLTVEEQENIAAILSTVVCTYGTLTIDTLSTLSGLNDADLVESALQPLRSVLHVSENNNVNLVTTLHASFPEFMFAQERSQDFFCDRPKWDQLLAERCLEIMKDQLRFNICMLDSSFIRDDKVPDLDRKVKANISQKLLYACRFWVDHLSQHRVPVPLGRIQEFLSQRLLFWMEVLNLSGHMVAGAIATTKLRMWLKRQTPSVSSDLIALAHDAQTFVGNYAAYNVSSSTPHLYLSALPLSSPANLIRLIYRPRFKGLIRASGTVMEKIDCQPSLGVWKLSSAPRSACFSPDRASIVTTDRNGEITIKDSQDGNNITSFKAHEKTISSISLSSCGMQVVTGSYDCTLCVWNVVDGKQICGPLNGHSKRVNSVRFSPDGRCLVSGSDDCTIRIWVKDNHHDSRKFLGHAGAVNSVTFSPDGMEIASGSVDHTVCVWNTRSGKLLSSLKGHRRSVSAVQFSPCGTFIASGSRDKDIRVWKLLDATFACVLVLQGHSQDVTSISISPEGDRIASGSLDGTVRVWHTGSTENAMDHFEGHTGPVRSVEFSSDGARVVSASDDQTIRLWNVQSRNHADSRYKTSGTMRPVGIVGLSRDGAYMTVQSTSRSIEIWDTQSGQRITHLPTRFDGANHIKFLEISPNNNRIFIGYKSGAIDACDIPIETAQFSDDKYTFTPLLKLDPLGSVILSPYNAHILSFVGTCSVDPKPAPASLRNTINHREIWLKEPLTNSSHFPKLSAFSLNGAHVVTTTTKGTIWVWNTHDGKCVAGPLTVSEQQYHNITAIDISFDGSRIIANSPEYALRICNVGDGSVSDPFIGHKSPLRQVKFSDDQGYVASIDSCNIVFIWNTHKQKIIEKHEFPRDPIFKHSEVLFRLSPSGLCSFCWVTEYGDAVQYRCFQAGSPSRFRTELSLNSDSPNSNGWHSDGDNLVVWVPPEIQRIVPRGTGLTIGRDGSSRVDYDQILGGPDWTQCYIGDPVDGGNDDLKA